MAEKRGEVVDLLVGQIQPADLEVDIRGIVLAEIAAAIVELDDLADRALSTIVEVRRRQLQIAQTRHLERPVRQRALANEDRRIGDVGERIGEQLL